MNEMGVSAPSAPKVGRNREGEPRLFCERLRPAPVVRKPALQSWQSWRRAEPAFERFKNGVLQGESE